MTGLIRQADGAEQSQAEALERAHRSWQESMSRRVSELRDRVRAVEPPELAARCGCPLQGTSLLLVYWGEQLEISWPAIAARKKTSGEDCSTFDAAMLLYYLATADGAPLSDRWISFRELPGGAFYHQAFQGYSGDRLARRLGDRPEAFDLAALALGGTRLSGIAEHGFAFTPLPRIRLAAVLWPGDDEFPAKASVLFDGAASHYMTTDGLALLGSGLVGRLIRASEDGAAPGASG